MQHPYVLRRFSSWSFRFSVSIALLLSSVGLAASLLASSTLGPPSQPRIAWKPWHHFPQPPSELVAAQRRAAAQALPVSLSSWVPIYSPALTTTYSLPSAGPANGATQAPADILKGTVQRSWDAFKLAFR